VARRVSDGSILNWLKTVPEAPIVERVGRKQRITSNKTGTPQGGVISPLLANIYLNAWIIRLFSQRREQNSVRYAMTRVLCRWAVRRGLRQRLEAYLGARG